MASLNKEVLQRRVFDVRAKLGDWNAPGLVNPTTDDNGFIERTTDFRVKMGALRTLISCPDGGTPSYILAGIESTLAALTSAGGAATPQSADATLALLKEAKEVYTDLVAAMESIGEEEEIDEDDVGGPSDGDDDNEIENSDAPADETY